MGTYFSSFFGSMELPKIIKNLVKEREKELKIVERKQIMAKTKANMKEWQENRRIIESI